MRDALPFSMLFLFACSEYNLSEKTFQELPNDEPEEEFVEDVPPIPIAGASVQTKRETLVQLTGLDSYDPDDLNGQLTYHWEIVSSPDGSAPFLDDSTAAEPYLFADILGDYVVELTVTDQDGLVSEYNSATLVEVIPYENLIIELNWDIDGVDLDLHLVRPEGLYYQESDCYYGNPNPDWGIEGDRTDNPTLAFDDEGTERREAIDYLRPIDGVYSIYALYYKNLTADYPYVTPHVTIYGENQVLADFDGPRLTLEGNVWHIGDIDWETLSFEMNSIIYDHVDLGGPVYDD
ncbi:MAG: hypothetical protein VX278_12755 [Myxococcota bacterium]|nr:hypothetical protein [Myxococcota bacterium]